ncbi:hypothetical protein MUY27_03030 [Mucilaginibacter sp. RS28]|uniref:Uncharacterized protein n=1 Tax=Mucilaginibacter straminoryzae TaxID=2932774 RepID=A0A9X2B8F5_9SPHI|nr:hypothetical protein [Mucilaginibacter straminoryzae]MCJ8208665.1 hypothetical protein [Mucilaginibacter straminoryzae]
MLKKIFIYIIGTTIFFKLVNRYGLLNVLFFGTLIIFSVVACTLWGFGKIINNDSEEIWAKSKIRDSIYLDDHYFQDTASKGLFVRRLIRPVMAADIDAMHIDQWKKDKLKLNLDTNAKPKLIYAKLVFSPDSALKYRDAFVGTIAKKDSTQDYDVVVWNRFIINPNLKICREIEPDTIPKGYMLANNDYYITANLVSLSEPETITKLRKQKIDRSGSDINISNKKHKRKRHL